MNLLSKVNEIVEERRDSFIALSNRIWEYAETKFEEHQSAEVICKLLEQEGFRVQRNVAGIRTAFTASYGSGNPIIGLLGEFDALPGLSQREAAAYYEPIIEGGNGHGCGHNLLGVAPLAAVIAIKQIMKEQGLSGTIRYFGCPAEEGGSGKTFMVRDGAFKDVDCALTWHPASYSSVFSCSTLANYQVYFSFKGKASHASSSPHLGRSALDAVELMNVGVNYLREHIIPEARIHYAITNPGGASANVVQGEAEVQYLIRAPQINEVKAIYERVLKIAQGAALMTETEMIVTFDKGCSNFVPNHALGMVLNQHLQAVGLPAYEEAEHRFAMSMGETITKLDREAAVNEISKLTGQQPKRIVKKLGRFPFFSDVFSFVESNQLIYFSTDVGDVSWVVPTAQFFGASFVAGTQLHSWQLVSQGKTSIAHKGMLQAAKVLALAALDLLLNPDIVEQAKEELQEVTEGIYQSPIPLHIKPSAVK
ncbi:M20 family metallopeptidase [Bacillus massiliigorillae]|uniref:M20 family metallopeptidase n=1 Tax=Bacillus massiliigorillae TaxID=1243664 RepID=UPI00039D75AB|nr:M20 family metallopeptidase [Bacillus massiliigorillae]